MRMSRAALWGVVLAIALVVAGPAIVTATGLGIAGWFLGALGIVVLIFAATRPRAPRP